MGNEPDPSQRDALTEYANQHRAHLHGDTPTAGDDGAGSSGCNRGRGPMSRA
jgi:hypothetical protein